MAHNLVQEATEIIAEAYRQGHAAGSADKLAAEEAAYDRGYDEGFAARDKLASTHSSGDNFKTQVVRVLREVGLLGNTKTCP